MTLDTDQCFPMYLPKLRDQGDPKSVKLYTSTEAEVVMIITRV